jgi:hypothetical protein
MDSDNNYGNCDGNTRMVMNNDSSKIKSNEGGIDDVA